MQQADGTRAPGAPAAGGAGPMGGLGLAQANFGPKYEAHVAQLQKQLEEAQRKLEEVQREAENYK